LKAALDPGYAAEVLSFPEEFRVARDSEEPLIKETGWTEAFAEKPPTLEEIRRIWEEENSSG